MADITDDYMEQMLTKAKIYSLVILRAAPKRKDAGVDSTVWEHARRNFSLRSDGLLPVVCAVSDDYGLSGIGIFSTTVEETRAIMEDDPGVKAGIFTYEVHPCRSFPGSSLP